MTVQNCVTETLRRPALKAGIGVVFLIFGCILAASGTASAQQRERPRGTAGAFDFYVLSLSWSPTFCAAQKNGGPAQQCAADKDFGLIVHGLWPQNERGYPEFCASTEPRRVPQALGEPLFDIMPSMGLIGHQWRKHGSCSGLSQRDYLAAIRTAHDRVTIPPELGNAAEMRTLSAENIEEGFARANPGLDSGGISLSCEGSRLEEVRICMTKDFGFRTCPQLDRRGCSLPRLTLPPARYNSHKPMVPR